MVVELDPDAATAVFNANGELENQATAAGDDPSGVSATDTSDDPNDASNTDANGDGEPDDPTTLIIPVLDAVKSVAATAPASSGTAGNHDVTYDIVVTNTGNATLDNLTLAEDFATQFGSAFIGVVGTPGVTAGAGAIAPVLSGTYDGGTTDGQLFDTISGEIETGESYTVSITIELDPDAVLSLIHI